MCRLPRINQRHRARILSTRPELCTNGPLPPGLLNEKAKVQWGKPLARQSEGLMMVAALSGRTAGVCSSRQCCCCPQAAQVACRRPPALRLRHCCREAQDKRMTESRRGDKLPRHDRRKRRLGAVKRNLTRVVARVRASSTVAHIATLISLQGVSVRAAVEHIVARASTEGVAVVPAHKNVISLVTLVMG
jgi:hypothetical protein